MERTTIDPRTASKAQIIEWLLWEASEQTVNHWATEWLTRFTIEELRDMMNE
jgi:hypothetical protein